LGAGAGADFAAAGCAADIAEGGMSFIAGLAGGGAGGFSGAGGGAAFSAAAGFASSSAMMRRIDARISSIEGSWTFAGCVISDSTSKPFYTKRHRIRWFRICRPEFSSIEPDLSPDQATFRWIALGPISPHGNQTTRSKRDKKAARIVLLPSKRYVMAIIDCKQTPVILIESEPRIMRFCWTRLLHAKGPPRDQNTGRPFSRRRFGVSDANATPQRPSGVRTPAQLSRTCW
jgi:hypothetical protein